MERLGGGDQAVSDPRELAAKRESRWQRIRAPHSYDPATGATYVRPFWHPIHLRAAKNRLRWWWWGKRGY